MVLFQGAPNAKCAIESVANGIGGQNDVVAFHCFYGGHAGHDHARAGRQARGARDQEFVVLGT